MSVESHRKSQYEWIKRNPNYQKQWRLSKYGVKPKRGICNRIHGEGNHQTIEYNRWCGMKSRCYNTTKHNYKYYGGRGIKVCDRWLEPKGKGYLNFISDMGRCPNKRFTLDRINNDGNYEPSNCRWTDKKTQANNRRRKGQC